MDENILLSFLNKLPKKDKNRIKKTDKKYIIIIPYIFESGGYIIVYCMNNPQKIYKKYLDKGGFILNSTDKIFKNIS